MKTSEIQQAAASTDPVELRQLAHSCRYRTRLAVALNEHAPMELRHKILSSDKNEKVPQEFFRTKNMPLPLLGACLFGMNTPVFGGASVENMALLVKAKYYTGERERWYSASASTPECILRSCAKMPHQRYILAKNPATPPDILADLAEQYANDRYIRDHLLGNPATPVATQVALKLSNGEM